MLNVYAQSFMTATRIGCVRMLDVPPVAQTKRRYWFSRRKTRCIDPAEL